MTVACDKSLVQKIDEVIALNISRLWVEFELRYNTDYSLK